MPEPKTAHLRKYLPADFLGVRDLLVDTYPTFGMPHNWGFERWNYARYFVIPMLAGYQEGVAYAPSVEESLEAIRAWENMIRVWEGDEGEVVGAVTIEYPWPGMAFFQRRPGYDFLLGEMVDYTEGSLVHRKRNEVRISVGGRDEPLQQLVRERGYTQDTENPEGHSSFLISGPPEPQLPPGFFFRTMADSNDIELRREVFGRAFNHPDPRDWPSAFAYEELQRAPDYRKDLDLYIVGPGGQYVACCIVWYDERNRVGMLEPVGTHPDFRRRGLG